MKLIMPVRREPFHWGKKKKNTNKPGVELRDLTEEQVSSEQKSVQMSDSQILNRARNNMQVLAITQDTLVVQWSDHRLGNHTWDTLGLQPSDFSMSIQGLPHRSAEHPRFPVKTGDWDFCSLDHGLKLPHFIFNCHYLTPQFPHL